jgi:hypothetical protein
MWEPRRLTTLWALTACYNDSFTFFYPYPEKVKRTASRIIPIVQWLSQSQTSATDIRALADISHVSDKGYGFYELWSITYNLIRAISYYDGPPASRRVESVTISTQILKCCFSLETHSQPIFHKEKEYRHNSQSRSDWRWCITTIFCLALLFIFIFFSSLSIHYLMKATTRTR